MNAADHLEQLPDHKVHIRVLHSPQVLHESQARFKKDLVKGHSSRWALAVERLAKTVPPVIDMRPIYVAAGGGIKNQQTEGCCTGETGAYDTALTAAILGIFGPSNQIPDPNGFSEQFLYDNELNLPTNNFGCQDMGAYEQDIGTALSLYGICFYSLVPLGMENCPAPQSAYGPALSWVWQSSQEPVVDENYQDAINICYTQQVPDAGTLRVGMPVFSSFFDAETNGGNVPIPSEDDTLEGGHSMAAIGKDDTHQNLDGTAGAYCFINSWGDVGDNGYFWIPYTYMDCEAVMNAGGTVGYQGYAAFTYAPPAPSNLTTTHAYAKAGTFTVTVSLQDANGNPISGSAPITVGGGPTPITATITYSPASPAVNQTVTFTATPQGGTAPYSNIVWNFGDGTAPRRGGWPNY